jgi:hypothetical protein
LIQIDGSDHRCFEQRGEPCTLLVFIDDATSKLMQLRFVPSESTDSYFSALQGDWNDHGCPVAFYSDKHTVFRVNRPDAMGGSGMTCLSDTTCIMGGSCLTLLIEIFSRKLFRWTRSHKPRSNPEVNTQPNPPLGVAKGLQCSPLALSSHPHEASGSAVPKLLRASVP